MNIFYLDKNPQKCASYHCDKHVVKMIVETAQLLSTTCHVTNQQVDFDIYRKTHVNHPSTIWVRSSLNNFNWLAEMGGYLCDEYTKRYNKVHKTEDMIHKFMWFEPILPDLLFYDPPQCMPEKFRSFNSITAYRHYYREGKKHILKYKNSPVPFFV